MNRRTEAYHQKPFGSLLLRYFCLISAVLVVPMALLNVVCFQYYSQSLSRQLESANYNTASKVMKITDMVFSEMKQLLTQMCLNEDINRMNSYNQRVFSNYYAIQTYNKLVDSFWIQSTTSDYIEEVSIYSIPNDYIFSGKGGGERPYYQDNQWVDIALQHMGVSEFWAQSRKVNGYPVISCYAYAPFLQTEKTGIIAIDLNYQRIEGLISGINEDYFETIVVLDGLGNVLIDNSPFGGAQLHQLVKKQVEEQHAQLGSVIFRQNDTNYVGTLLQSSESGFSYLLATSVQSYLAELYNLQRFMLMATLFSILAALILAFVVARKVYQPIRQIRQLLDQRHHPPKLAQDYRLLHTDEYNYIVDTLRSSLKHSDDMDQELESRLQLLSRAKTAALQAHIHPHFLCNTLETINFMALRQYGGQNGISEMVTTLSSLLRQSLETEDALTTFGEEVTHAQEYLKIQNIRYQDKFEVDFRIAPQCLSCRVIKIMLQPIIENAIYHGIKPLFGKKGLILVEAWPRDSVLFVCISNNGMALDEQMTARLNHSLDQEYIQKDRHIGLANVSQRIKLLFGDNYGLHVEACSQDHPEGMTVSVTLTLPYINGDAPNA